MARYTKPVTKGTEAPTQVSLCNVSHALITGSLWLTICATIPPSKLVGLGQINSSLAIELFIAYFSIMLTYIGVSGGCL